MTNRRTTPVWCWLRGASAGMHPWDRGEEDATTPLGGFVSRHDHVLFPPFGETRGGKLDPGASCAPREIHSGLTARSALLSGITPWSAAY